MNKMTSQEKAKELVDRFYYMLPNNGSHTGINNVESRYKEAKQCALIAIEEVLQTIWEYHLQAEWWQEVKEEIENL
jgi:hypothetical protein